jgi:hypothetical protein
LGIASRILTEAASDIAVDKVTTGFKKLDQAQRKFLTRNKQVNKSLETTEETLQATAVATKENVKQTGLLSRMWHDGTGAIKKYGVEISAATATVQLLRLEQRALTKGLDHYYRSADRIPTQLGETNSALEMTGRLWPAATKRMGQALTDLGDTGSKVLKGDLGGAWKELNQVTDPDYGGMADTILGKKGTLGVIARHRRLAANIQKDAHGLAKAYNIPAEAVRDLQTSVKNTLRMSAHDTEAYRKTVDKTSDNILFAARALGVDQADALQFVNHAMYEHGQTAEDASKMLAHLNQSIELSNKDLQKQGVLAKGATAQWKDDYAKAVLEATMASKALYLDSQKLADSMMAASHAAHEAGLEYNQTQRLMKGIPTALGNVDTFMQKQIGDTFLKKIQDPEQYKKLLSELAPEQVESFKKNVEAIKSSKSDPLYRAQAAFALRSGMKGGQAEIIKSMMKVGGPGYAERYLGQKAGLDPMDAIMLTKLLREGKVDDFEKQLQKGRGPAGKLADETHKAQKESLGLTQKLGDVTGAFKRLGDEITENKGLLMLLGATGGGKSVLRYLRGGVPAGAGGATISGVPAAAGGGGAAAMALGGGGGGGGGGSGLLSLVGTGLLGGILGGGSKAAAFAIPRMLGIASGTGTIGSVLSGLQAAAPVIAGVAGTAAAIGGSLLVFGATLKGAEYVAMKIAKTDKTILEWREMDSKNRERIAKRDEADLKAGKMRLSKDGKTVTYSGTGGAADESFKRMLSVVPEGKLSNLTAKDLNEKTFKGRNFIGYMWANPKYAADISQALQEQGVSPKTIEDALILRALQNKATNSTLKQKLAAAQGPGIAERLTTRKEEERQEGIRIQQEKQQQREAVSNEAVQAARAHFSGGNQVMAPSAQTGGYVARAGLVNVHPAEVIVPHQHWKSIVDQASGGFNNLTTVINGLTSPLRADYWRNAQGGGQGGGQGAPKTIPYAPGNLQLTAKVDPLGKLTLVAEDFFKILQAYDHAKENVIPWGTGVPR